jgi:hypothetical protein
VSVTITGAERDALYEHLYVRLSGIGDVWLAAEAGDFEAATRLGRDFCDDLRLLLEDLGWGAGRGESLELRTPPEVLVRVLERIRAAAAMEQECEERQRLASGEREAQATRTLETCRQLLEELGAS